jgi:hypothetical protein
LPEARLLREQLIHHAAAKDLEVVQNILEIPDDARAAGLAAEQYREFLNFLQQLTDECGRQLNGGTAGEDFEIFRLDINVPNS